MLEYSYKVKAARVASQGDLKDVVREVDVVVCGIDGPAKFELPTSAKFDEADEENFTPFDELTEEQIAGWLDNNSGLDAIRNHIALVISRELARLGMEQKPLPWAPSPSSDDVVVPTAITD